MHRIGRPLPPLLSVPPNEEGEGGSGDGAPNEEGGSGRVHRIVKPPPPLLSVPPNEEGILDHKAREYKNTMPKVQNKVRVVAGGIRW